MTKTKLTRFEISGAVVSEMEHDGNPAVRRAAETLRVMLERHGSGEYNRAKDLQSIDDANFSLPANYRLRDGLDKYPPAKMVMASRPDEYERYTGRKVTIEESYVLRERAFHAAHVNDWVVVCAWGDWQPGVPKGMVGVRATVGEKYGPNVEGRYFVVEQAEYDKREGAFVIDLARHHQVEDFTQTEATTKRIA